MNYYELLQNQSIQNKYLEIYIRLMRRAQTRASNRTQANQILGKNDCVRHHIVPVSFFVRRVRVSRAGWLDGDSEHPDNYAFLTHREHVVAHLCLVKFINVKSGLIKMSSALARMTKHKNISTRTIALINKKHSEFNPFRKRSDGTSIGGDTVKNLAKNGKHQWQGPTHNQKMINEGRHISQNPEFVNPFNRKSDGSSVQTKRVKNGTHHLLGGEIQRKLQKRLVSEGRHCNQNGEIARKQLLDGTHCSQIMISCVNCKRVYTSSIFFRDHGDNCDVVNPRKSVVIDGITYNSRRLAAEALNVTEYQIKVMESGKKPRPTFTHDNVEYRSIAAATKATGLSWYFLTKS